MSLVLVPIDGSAWSERAIDALVERARGKPSTSVTLLYVHEPQVRYGRVLLFQPKAAADAFRARRAGDVLRRGAARLEAAGVAVSTLAEDGDLYPTIAQVATRVGASEVVLGVRTPWLARLRAALAGRLRPLGGLGVPVTYRP
jgi:hypothetical protein